MTSSSPREAGRRLVRGRLDASFARDPEGRTYIDRQFASYPFHVCRALYQDAELPELATLYLQSCSGGLYQDDALELHLSAGSGARAHVTTQASTIVHSMPAGEARQEVRLTVQAGAFLEYLPDPQILFPQSRFNSKTTVVLSAGAAVLLCDGFLAHDPAGADAKPSFYESLIVLETEDGRRLAVDRISLDMATTDLAHVGLMGGFGAQGTFVCAIPGADARKVLGPLQDLAHDPAALVGVSTLPNAAGLIVRILARDGSALARAMNDCWNACRFVLLSLRPTPRRK